MRAVAWSWPVAEILMPSLGADMESGLLVEWRIRPGDHVSRGDVIAVVETDKGVIEAESFVDGRVEELLVAPGARADVGVPIARLAGGGDASGPSAEKPQAPAKAPERTSTRVRATPGARRAAERKGVDLARVAGSGAGGTVTEADVERAVARPPSEGDDEGRRQALRRSIGALMARSKREIPHYYLAHTIDMTAALALVAARNAGRPPRERLVPTALVLRAVALAAREVPEVNGTVVDEGFVPSERVNVGLAVAMRGGGVVAPAIADVDGMDLEEVMSRVREVSGRARRGLLRSSEITEGTITLSALGDRNVEEVHGVIFHPQVALVGAGSILERPWAREGRVEIVPTMRLSLAADHRASDGRRGGAFLVRVARLLESPEEL